MAKAEDEMSLTSMGEPAAVRKFRRRERRIIRSQLAFGLIFTAVAVANVILCNVRYDHPVRLGWGMDEIYIAGGVTGALTLAMGIAVLRCPTKFRRLLFFSLVAASSVLVGYSAVGFGQGVSEGVHYMMWKTQQFRCLYQMEARCAQTTTTTSTATVSPMPSWRRQTAPPLPYTGDDDCYPRSECDPDWIHRTKDELQWMKPGWEKFTMVYLGLLLVSILLMAAYVAAGAFYLLFAVRFWQDGKEGPFWGLTKDHPHVLYISCCCEPRDGADVVPFIVAIGPRAKLPTSTEQSSAEQDA